MAAERTPDRRRWQFGIGALVVLQAITCLVMSVYATFGTMAIVAILLLTIPLGMIIVGTVLVAMRFQEVGDWYSRLGRKSFYLFALPVGIFFLVVLIVKLFSR